MRRRRDGVVVALAVGVALALGCGRRLKLPTGTGSGTTATGGGSDLSSAIVGRWSRIEVLQTQTDVTTTETDWVFNAGGSCQRAVTTNTVSAGVPLTTTSDCSYTLGSASVTITFAETSGSVTFSVGFSGSSLLLNGVAFARS